MPDSNTSDIIDRINALNDRILMLEARVQYAIDLATK